MLRPYDRIKFRGVVLNRRTVRMVRWAERRAGFKFKIAQGSYNRGGVGASAGTHDGGGAVDIGMAGVSKAQRVKAVRSLKLAGFAAWYRPAVPGVWGPHIHAIAFGDKEASAGAAAQRRSFDRGRDGLARDRVDNTFRPNPRRGFSFALSRPITRRPK